MKTFTLKLVHRIVILVLLAIGAAFALSSDRVAQPASAAPCCDECDPAFQFDLQSCYDSYPPGPALDNCITIAQNRRNSCYQHCILWCD